MAKLRTSDGFLSVVALKAGGIEQQSWTEGGITHYTELTLFREQPEPPLYRVKHTAFSTLEGKKYVVASSNDLYDDVRRARNQFRKLRNTPPTTITTNL